MPPALQLPMVQGSGPGDGSSMKQVQPMQPPSPAEDQLLCSEEDALSSGPSEAGSDDALSEDPEQGSDSEELPESDMEDENDGDGLGTDHHSVHSAAQFQGSTDNMLVYEGEADSGSELDAAELVFCRNCTNNMYGGWCPSCGHTQTQDAVLVGSSGQELGQEEQQEQQMVKACVVAAAVQPEAGVKQVSSVAAAAATAVPVVRMKGLAPPVALLYDERMEQHDEGKPQPHPERPDRIRAIMTRLHAAGLTEHCIPIECVEASLEQLAAVHTADLIAFVKAMSSGLPPPPEYPAHLLTPDTYINAHTYSCARLAAGGAAAVATTVAQGKAGFGAAIVRPPGHHAESNMAMGFCFFNNAAVAARAAQAAGAHRVLILDWDIHHGNGTQHIFEEDNSVMYMSLHRYEGGRFYPGTGAPDEVGAGLGTGYTVNVAWDGDELHNGDYLAAFQHLLVPIAYEYNPHLIIVSAGFDAADGDPIGGCRVTPECFAHMTSMLKAVAPCVLLLEGGYNLSATARSTEACLRVLLGEQPPVLPRPPQPSYTAMQGILSTIRAQAPYWNCVRTLAAALQSTIIKPASTHSVSAAVVVPAAPTPPAPPPPPRLPREPSIAAPVPTAGVPPLVAAVRHSLRGAAQAQQQEAREARRCARRHQLLCAVRQRALKAWWARHKRVVRARRAAPAARLAASTGLEGLE